MAVKIPKLREVLVEFCEKQNLPKKKQVYATLEGNCYAVSLVMAKMMGRGARSVYGKYHGHNVDRPSLTFHRHGWVVYKDTIYDPTRWVFEGKRPHMWIGPEDSEEYDEGGWKMMEKPDSPFKIRQPERGDGTLRRMNWSSKDVEEVVSELFDDKRECDSMSMDEIYYVVHVSPKYLGVHAIEVYRRARELKLGAMIPIDSQHYADSLINPTKRKSTRKRPRGKK